MSDPRDERRVLILAPTGRDADLARNEIERAGFTAQAFPTAEALCAAVSQGAGAVLLAEEALSPETLQPLSALLRQQPPWSDLPIIIFAAAANSVASTALFARLLELLGNVTLIERPVHPSTLVASIRAALRGRLRQYMARESLEAMERQETALKRADQRKDEFLAMLAHELRNPLAAISLALSLLDRAEDEPARTERYRATAKRQTANLVRLVDDLLDVSRITRGVVELRRRPIDLAQVVQAAVTATRPTIEAREHELTLTLAPGVFPIHADTTRIEQVISNLLTNAAKYTPPGGHVSVRLTRDEATRSAVLSVKDTGRGIPEHMLRTVFDLFVQVEPGLDRTIGGLGLGLTLVKTMVEMHGGRVEARSSGTGQGAEFLVRIPLLKEGTPIAEPPRAFPPQRSERRRIVVVEDSDDIRESLKELLEDIGHEVHVAATGTEAAPLIESTHPDIAFVDVGLPGIDGYEVARRVRAQNALSDVLLIALTGYGGPEAKAKAKSAGFDRHLTKPLEMKELRGLIDGRLHAGR